MIAKTVDMFPRIGIVLVNMIKRVYIGETPMTSRRYVCKLGEDGQINRYQIESPKDEKIRLLYIAMGACFITLMHPLLYSSQLGPPITQLGLLLLIYTK